ncbi:cell wall-active antibiotics response protein LiaF [Paenibacillus kobensis]|uniref:cell wall-active antibiotics response protein LiaF n=1 Tax=Paenibacillus kobensis TaxID=59841 RepID=UPI001FE8D5C0|nr:cell wall-active antibiotics response protein LiaF [Paenibacillus kobensis]
MNRHYASRIFWGMFIVVLGGSFLLKQFGFVEFDIGDIVSTFWPVFMIFAGLNSLLFSRDGGGAWWGGIVISIGFIFLGRNLEWFEWSVGDIFRFAAPVVLILFGLNMIFKPKWQGKRHYDGHNDRHNDWQAYKPGGYVPPAPPLHPDPTTAGFEEGQVPPAPPAPDQADNGNAAYRPDLSKQHKQHFREMNRSMREQMREMRRQEHRKHHNPWERVEWWDNNPNAQNRSGFIGDIHIGQDHWELKPLNISHFIGDTVLDLTKAYIPSGETKITISSFIGDVKIYLPNDYEVGIHVVSSAFIGDARVLDMRDSRVFRSMDFQTPFYKETEKKIKLVCSTFIGDVRVTKVG